MGAEKHNPLGATEKKQFLSLSSEDECGMLTDVA